MRALVVAEGHRGRRRVGPPGAPVAPPVPQAQFAARRRPRLRRDDRRGHRGHHRVAGVARVPRVRIVELPVQLVAGLADARVGGDVGEAVGELRPAVPEHGVVGEPEGVEGRGAVRGQDGQDDDPKAGRPALEAVRPDRGIHATPRPCRRGSRRRRRAAGRGSGRPARRSGRRPRWGRRPACRRCGLRWCRRRSSCRPWAPRPASGPGTRSRDRLRCRP